MDGFDMNVNDDEQTSEVVENAESEVPDSADVGVDDNSVEAESVAEEEVAEVESLESNEAASEDTDDAAGVIDAEMNDEPADSKDVEEAESPTSVADENIEASESSMSDNEDEAQAEQEAEGEEDETSSVAPSDGAELEVQDEKQSDESDNVPAAVVEDKETEPVKDEIEASSEDEVKDESEDEPVDEEPAQVVEASTDEPEQSDVEAQPEESALPTPPMSLSDPEDIPAFGATTEPVAEEQDIPTAPEPPEKEDDREWYVVHCYSGYENKVRHNLEQRIESMGMKDLIFDVVVPTEEEIEVKDGKRRTIERRVFPGYILVNMIMDEEPWYVVRNTPGVTSFVGMGEEPIPLRPEEVAQIIKRMESDAPRIKVTFKQGERVRIVDGPFNDFRGTVNEIDMEKAKVRVMVNFFGRETPVELDFLQVEKS